MFDQDYYRRYFKYTCMIDPIKKFDGCMDVKDYALNMCIHVTGIEFIDAFIITIFNGLAMAMYREVIEKTKTLCDEMPEKVLFFGIPALVGEHFVTCAVSQVCEENKTYLFTPNFDFAAMYATDGREVTIW